MLFNWSIGQRILTIDKSCLGDKCGELSKEKMAKIDETIKRSLALN